MIYISQWECPKPDTSLTTCDRLMSILMWLQPARWTPSNVPEKYFRLSWSARARLMERTDSAVTESGKNAQRKKPQPTTPTIGSFAGEVWAKANWFSWNNTINNTILIEPKLVPLRSPEMHTTPTEFAQSCFVSVYFLLVLTFSRKWFSRIRTRNYETATAEFNG